MSDNDRVPCPTQPSNTSMSEELRKEDFVFKTKGDLKVFVRGKRADMKDRILVDSVHINHKLVII